MCLFRLKTAPSCNPSLHQSAICDRKLSESKMLMVQCVIYPDVFGQNADQSVRSDFNLTALQGLMKNLLYGRSAFRLICMTNSIF